MAEDFLKYGLILRPADGEVLIKGSICPSPKPYAKEAKKIIKKLYEADLRSDERKKIVSPKHGKWLAECDDQSVIHVCLISEDYPERLGYKFLQESRGAISEVNSYWSESQTFVEDAYRTKFFELMTKFNDPNTFDRITSINKKVDQATEIMKDNLGKAMENTENLEVS